MIGLLPLFHHVPKWLPHPAALSAGSHSLAAPTASGLKKGLLWFSIGFSTEHDFGLTKTTVQQGTQLLQ